MHIALLIPALDEARAMPRTAAAAHAALGAGLVDSVTVLDGGSRDGTPDIAADAGLGVLAVASLMPHLGAVLGKGDSLFRGVHSLEADWYVFLDADIGNVSASHVAALVAPIARAESNGTVFVKGGFVRVDEHGLPRAVPGGRVTEEVARPILTGMAPELASLSQPLSGQVAVRGDVARGLSFATGYGVEIAMLIDICRAHGPGSIVESDMGRIENRWKDDADLDAVAADVLAAAHPRVAGLAPPPAPLPERHPAAGA